MHPALLDAALHLLALTAPDSEDGQIRLPFAWTGVAVRGAVTGPVDVRLHPDGPDALSLTATGPDGTLVFAVGSLRLRPVPAAVLAQAASGACDPGQWLFHLEWQPLPPAEAQVGGPGVSGWVTIGDPAAAIAAGLPALPCYPSPAEAAGTIPAPVLAMAAVPDPDPAQDLPEQARDAAVHVLSLIQDWVLTPGLDQVPLVIGTRNAVAAHPADTPASPVHAAAWGLARAAQSEYPGRILLLDTDTHPDTQPSLPAAITAALDAGETQLAVRAGQPVIPRLHRDTAATILTPPPVPAWRLDLAADFAGV
jgi:hypothetical protein